MKRIAIFLSDPQVAAFKRMAAEKGRPYAELIREALDEYLRWRETGMRKKADRPRAGTRERS